MKYLLLICSFVIFGCSVQQTCPETKDDAEFMNGYSKLHVPIVISKLELEDFVNSKLPDTLYQDDDAGGQGIEVEVFKTGRPSLSVQGRSAELVLPLSIKAVRDLGFLKARAEGDLFLGLKTTVEINPDWTWKLSTEITKIDWVREPKLKMAGLNLSVKGIIERMLSGPQSPITEQLDEALTSSQLLKKFLDDVQPSFQRAYSLDPEERYFIQVLPKNAGLSSFTEEDGHFITQVVVEGEAILLEDTASFKTEVPHPIFEWADNKVADKDMTAHVSFRDKEIENLFRKEAIGQSFKFRGKRVTVDQIYFDLQDDKIKVDANVSGGIKGKVHFEGKPYWDENREEIEFCNQAVDMKLDYGFSKFLLWLAKPSIKKALANKVESSINEEIETRLEEINRYLKDFRPSKDVMIGAEIYSWSVNPIEISNRHLNFGINLQLRGQFSFQDLNFKIQ